MNNIQLDRTHFTRRVEISVSELDNAIYETIALNKYEPIIRVLTRYLQGTGLSQYDIKTLSHHVCHYGMRRTLLGYQTPIGVISLK